MSTVMDYILKDLLPTPKYWDLDRGQLHMVEAILRVPWKSVMAESMKKSMK